MNMDDFNIDKLNEIEDEKPPKKTTNRTFLMVAGILGAIMIMSLILMAVYAMIIIPNRRADESAQIAEVNLQNTQIAMASELTAQADAGLAAPNTRTPVPGTATPRPTIVIEAIYTAVPTISAIEEARTATVAALSALSTQQAENPPTATATPVSTLEIEATNTPTATLAAEETPTATLTADATPGGEALSGAVSIYPTFAITAVSRNNYVSILTEYLPADEDFIVTMGFMGTAGIGGYVVETTNSGAGGQIALTYEIPAALYDQYKIAIRMVSMQSGYYAFNWFYNNDANVSESTPSDSSDPESSSAVLPSSYDGYPIFSIVKVVEDTSVEIVGTNFPPNDTFLVRMNLMFTRGIAGTIVETVTTDADGNLSDVEFDIPSLLTIANRIAIRLESPTSGYYAYDWFYNNDANVADSSDPESSSAVLPSSYDGYPTFSIAKVVEDTSVEIVGTNFPPNDTFLVRMNLMYTRGIAGTIVETVTTDADGNLSDVEFDIPSLLYSLNRIAIRLESPTSGYYAYDWFYNNDAP